MHICIACQLHAFHNWRLHELFFMSNYFFVVNFEISICQIFYNETRLFLLKETK